MRHAALAVCLVSSPALAVGADWAECRHTAPRSEQVGAAGVRSVRIVARAGSLAVTGRAGAAAVSASGTACASSEARLQEIRLHAQRTGDTVLVRADIPESSGWVEWEQARLDLVIDVPAGVSVDVEDGSGPLTVRGVAAARVRDGSGEIELQEIAGEARVTDGSGSIDIRDAGSVLIDEDGSGSITVAGVRGSVTVRDDGSGSISVRDVAGDFTVEDDGSGGISHDGVRGRVRVPSRR